MSLTHSKNFQAFRKTVGAKIALLTASGLIFVTTVLLLIFFLLETKILSKINLIPFTVAFVILLVFVEIVLVVLSASLFVQKPLQKLTETMHLSEEGDFLARVSISSEDEMGELAQRFNTMMAKITDLESRKIEAERELIAARETIRFKKELEEKANQLKESLHELSLLFEISQTLGPTLEMADLFNALNRILKEKLGIVAFSFLSFDPKLRNLTLRALEGYKESEAGLDLTYVGIPYFLQPIFDEKRRVLEKGIFLPTHGKMEGNSEFMSLFLPLIVGKEIQGVLALQRGQEVGFTDEEMTFLESLAAQVAMAYDRSRLYTKTRELSVTDELTGLNNRRHFFQTLRQEWKRATRFAQPLSLLMIDVDNFKNFNDTYGHVAGDLVLRKLGGFLLDTLREVDTVARFGGEEFVVLLPKTSLEQAVRVAEKIRTQVELNQSYLIPSEAKAEKVTLSIGVSGMPLIASSEEELVNTSDQALYEAKAAGRNRTCVAAPSQSAIKETLPINPAQFA